MFRPPKRHLLGLIYKGVQVKQILCFNTTRAHLWHNLYAFVYVYAFLTMTLSRSKHVGEP
jgi:hypothetical protein